MGVTRRFAGIGVRLAESGRLPDAAVRWGIRRLCAARLEQDVPRDPAAREEAAAAFVRSMQQGPVAPVPDLANAQHYEVPPEFFRLVLGPRLKYSCCLFERGDEDLAAAEGAALRVTVERAGLADGQDVLELGCGWGSLTLYAAERYPNSRILAVSNSAPQRRDIVRRAEERGLRNVEVRTADMNGFDPGARFDRVVSVEMFEHMRNYGRLLGRIRGWLRPAGRLFAHVFCHRDVPYAFEDAGQDDWMARHFFSGGIMPSRDLFSRFPRDFAEEARWTWDGTHYRRTADAWLARLDARRDDVAAALRPVHGEHTELWITRRRLFFLGVSELFGYAGGGEWGVVHTLLAPRPDAGP